MEAPALAAERPRFLAAVREAAQFLFHLAVAQIVSAAFLAQWGRDISDRLPQWLDDSMPRPFAFRRLVRWCLETAMAVLPVERLQSWLTKPVGGAAQDEGIRVVDQALVTYRVPDAQAVPMVLVDLGLVFALVAIAYVWRALLTSCGLPRAVRWIAPGLFLLALPVHFANGGYIYDVPELLFASLATLAVVRGRWFAFYPVLTLAVLNKESGILLALVGIVFLVRKEWRRAWIHAGLSALFGVLPFLWIRFALGDRPGLDMIDYTAHNLAYLASPSPWLGRGRIFHPLLPYPSALNLLLVGLFVAFVAYRFRARPLELRVTFLALLLATLPLFLAYGFESEVRVFALAYPAAMALAAHTLAEMFGEPVGGSARTRPDPTTSSPA